MISFRMDMQFWLMNLPFLGLLFILSVVSLGLIIEKSLLFYRWRCHKKKLRERISVCLREQNIGGLSKLLEGEHGAEAILLRKSFFYIKNDPAQRPQAFPDSKGHKEILDSLSLWLQGCIDEQILTMERHLGLFNLIANVSTLIGLLGTVTGMIYAFASGSLAQSQNLAQGIAQALITTASGLVVAIPAMICLQLCQNAIRIRHAGLEQIGRDILLFRNLQERDSYVK